MGYVILRGYEMSALLCVVLRSRRFLENGSRWSVGDMRKMYEDPNQWTARRGSGIVGLGCTRSFQSMIRHYDSCGYFASVFVFGMVSVLHS